MHAISSYRGIRPTNKHTHRQDWLQYTEPLSLEAGRWVFLPIHLKIMLYEILKWFITQFNYF